MMSRFKIINLSNVKDGWEVHIIGLTIDLDNRVISSAKMRLILVMVMISLPIPLKFNILLNNN